MKIRSLLSLLLTLALVSGLVFAVPFAGSAAEANTVGTADTAITLLPADGTPSEIDTSTTNPFAIKTTHGVTYWNFGAGNSARAVTYTFDAPVAGDYYLAINFNTKNARQLNVSTNGGATQTASFVQNSAQWGDHSDASTVTWGYGMVKVTLVKGENTLVLARAEGTNAPMFADLILYPASEWLTAADSPVTTGKEGIVIDSAASFDGKALDANNTPSTVTWNITVPSDGLYRLSYAYSTKRNAPDGFGISVAGNAISVDTAMNSTYGYGPCWRFNSSEEFFLKAGENVPVTLSYTGGAFIGGVRLELVESYLSVYQEDLTVSYSSLNPAPTVYSLEIAWENDDFDFDYAAGTQGKWDPTRHEFGEASGAAWEDQALSVTVKNHSNQGVNVQMTVLDADGADGLTVTSDKQEAVTLASAEGTTRANAPSVEFALTISGTPTQAVEKVATARLSFTAAE